MNWFIMCMRKILLGLALMLPVLLGNAQVLVDVKVDSLQLFIGEQTNLTLSVTLGAKQKVQLPTLKKGDQIIPLIEVLNVQRPDTNYIDEGKRMEETAKDIPNQLGAEVVKHVSVEELKEIIPALDKLIEGLK